MKIMNAIYRINTVDMRDLKENIKEVMNKINMYVTNVKMSNIPQDAPANLPRLIATDVNGMFNIVMTNQSIEIQAIKAQDANDEVILEKMAELVDHLGSFFEDYSDAPFKFCGYTISTKITAAEISENPTDYVADRTKGIDSELIVDNAMMRKCFIQGDYYINITLRNDKQMKVSAPKQGDKPTKVEVTDEFIVAEIDVNDKYSFLNKPEYECEIEQAITLCEDVANFYREKMLTLAQTGSFDYFK